MPFGAHVDKHRTFDPSRDLEIRTVSGGSDGSLDFIIHRLGDPGNVLGGFTARWDTRPPTEAELSDHPEVTQVIIWRVRCGFAGGWLLKGFTLDESKAIIREALLAYRIANGKPEGASTLVLVDF